MDFSEFINEYRAGSLNAMLGMELQKLVAATQKFAKPGKMNIVISVAPKQAGETNISIKFENKMPKRDTVTSIMFVTPEGNLVDDDPTQPKLFDKVDNCLVDSETGEVITPTRKIGY